MLMLAFCLPVIGEPYFYVDWRLACNNPGCASSLEVSVIQTDQSRPRTSQSEEQLE